MLVINFIIIISIIYLNLYLRKRNFFYKKYIDAQLEEWITKAILDEPDKVEQGFEIPQKFSRILKNFIARQFVIDELLLIATIPTMVATAATEPAWRVIQSRRPIKN